MHYFTYNFELFDLLIAERGDCFVYAGLPEKFRLEGYEKKETALIKSAKEQLEEYFNGERRFFDTPLKFIGTEFQKKVWAELCKIPYGKTASYKELAQKIGEPNAARAVGSACNKNPLLIVVPCHRVVASSGALGGFALGINIKKKLLELEHNFFFVLK